MIRHLMKPTLDAVIQSHGWTQEDFSVIYKGITRWKREGRQEALWLHYGNSASAERARRELVKHHHAKDVDVLGAIVVVNGGIDYLEKEVDGIKVHKHFTAKLRTALQEWNHKGGDKPLVLSFLSQDEVALAKQEVVSYTNKYSEGPIAYGMKLIIPSVLAQELNGVFK